MLQPTALNRPTVQPRCRLLLTALAFCLMTSAAHALWQDGAADGQDGNTDSGAPASGQTDDYADRYREALMLEKPLLPDFEQARTDFRRKLRTTYNGLILRGTTRKSDEAKVIEGLTFSLFNMTDPKLPRIELPAMREDIVKDLNDAGKLMDNDTARKKFRTFVMSETIKLCEQLLDNNLYVRVQAVTILGSLDTVYARPPGVPEPYIDSYVSLLKVVDNPQEFDQIKFQAVVGLIRLIKYGKLPERIEMEIGGSLARELQRKNTESGYQNILCVAIGKLNYAFEVRGNRRPVGLMALAATLTDKDRDWRTRTLAARAIGRTGDNLQGVVWDPLAFKITQLAHEAAVAYNEDPTASYWNECFWELYLAFHHENLAERNAQKGLLNRAQSTYVRDAYEQTLPLVKHIVFKGRGQKIDDAKLKTVKDWLDANPPQSLEFHSKAPPLAAL